MYNLVDWIDKSLEEISEQKLFKEYFLNKSLEKDDNVYFLCNQAKGIDLCFSKELIITTIFLFSENYEGNKIFTGNLPFDLEFYLSRIAVHEKLGMPQKNGGGHRSILTGFVFPWDKYYFSNYSLHIQYPESEERIQLVSISSLALESYLNSNLQ